MATMFLAVRNFVAALAAAALITVAIFAVAAWAETDDSIPGTAPTVDAGTLLWRSNNSRTGNYLNTNYWHRVSVRCKNVYGATWYQVGPNKPPGYTSSTTCYYGATVWFLYAGGL